MTNDLRGKPLGAPGKTPFRAFNAALGEYEGLVSERAETRNRLTRLEREGRAAAVSADRRRLAAAIRSGSPDRGDKPVREHEAEVEATRRRLEALELAIASSWDDLVELVEREREKWLRALEKSLAGAEERALAALGAYAAARGELYRQHALRVMLRDFPTRFRQVGPDVDALKTYSGERLSWATVLAALEADCEPAT
jgi:hypothetical protein